MRTCIVLVSIVAATVVACAKSEDTGEKSADAKLAEKAEAEAPRGEASATLDAKATLPAPRIGGTVTLVGDAAVEVVVHRSGLVEAVVHGEKDVDLSPKAKLGVTASTKSGGRESITLGFLPAHACLEGKASAGVELASGPVDLSLELDGRKAEARADFVVALEPPRFGGHVLALGNHSVELVSKGKELSAFVLDANGKAVADANLDLKLHASTQGGPGLALVWDANSASYRADVGADLSAEPLFVTLAHGGKRFVAGLASPRAAMDLSAKRAASLDATASAKVGAKAEVKAPALGAKVDVAAPKVSAGALAKAGAATKAAAGATAGAKLEVTAPKIQVQAPKVDVSVKKSVTGGAKAGGSAKASAGFSLGTK